MADFARLPGQPACRKVAGRIPYYLLLLTVFLVLTSSGMAAEDVVAHTEKLQKLRANIKDIKTEIESMYGQRDDLRAALGQAEKEIGRVAAELHRLDADAEATQQKIMSLNMDRVSERQLLAGLRQTLMRDLQSAYAAGRQPQIKLLLNQQDPVMVGRIVTYHGFFTRARATRMQELSATLNRIDVIEHALVEQQAEIEQLQQRRREQSARLISAQDNRRKILTGLQSTLRTRSTELSTLQQDEQRLQSLLQSLRQAMRDIPPEAGTFSSLRQLKGKLQWPVAGRIVRHYGQKQAAGGLQSRGILIATRSGADVRAIAAGRIAFADWLRGFGLLMIIDHGDGYMSLYGQNHSLYKAVGDWVNGSEVVAAAGSSGGLDQDGLYLELRKDGQPFNPTAWFSGPPSPQQSSR